jgi:hypothetical protein
MAWSAVVPPDRRSQILALVTQIADRATSDRYGPAARWNLSSGQAGEALLLSWLTAAGVADHGDAATELLIDAFEGAAGDEPARASFFSGMSGIGFVIEQHTCLTSRSLPGDPCSQIDEALTDLLESWTWTGDYDLVDGLVGVGIYCLARLPRRSAARAVERIVRLLDEGAEAVGPGVAWFTPPEELPPHQVAEFPQGFYNLGVAHGVPGVISFLAQACASGVARSGTEQLVEGAVAWLLDQRVTNTASAFPYSVAPGIEPKPARSAWCYGDPGVAAVLVLAGQVMGRSGWRNAGLAVARNAALRPPGGTGVVDAGLCHGAGGLAQIFNRLFHATGDELFALSARSWLASTVEMTNGTPGRVNGTGFLEGTSGVGLALLAATTPLEPAWDAALAISTYGWAPLR